MPQDPTQSARFPLAKNRQGIFFHARYFLAASILEKLVSEWHAQKKYTATEHTQAKETIGHVAEQPSAVMSAPETPPRP